MQVPQTAPLDSAIGHARPESPGLVSVLIVVLYKSGTSDRMLLRLRPEALEAMQRAHSSTFDTWVGVLSMMAQAQDPEFKSEVERRMGEYVKADFNLDFFEEDVVATLLNQWLRDNVDKENSEFNVLRKDLWWCGKGNITINAVFLMHGYVDEV